MTGAIELKVFIPIMAFVLLVACSGRNELPIERSTAIAYIEEKGYKVISYEGQSSSYELTKEKLIRLPYMMYWGLMPFDPADYIGKTVNIEKFIVTNHPLAKGKVDVYVYEVNSVPIGGTSFPHGDKSDGGYWSLEGKTLEELQPKSFQDWREEWVNKYSE
ncbi:hypothetical protein [Paenibacillus harenae]|uniref:hypothetical protein n=1 Tax=Paenibacillus harenae TaxID=306543 RepID=UPI00279511A1|nr:hypothetical protein [Paenibacillus harenae]MDQ0061454.1 hypothetical protein [Paenibacillus harenae]